MAILEEFISLYAKLKAQNASFGFEFGLKRVS
jgi:hypothetical protein